MSFQAYLDNVETKTGKTPSEFITLAKEKNLTKHTDIVAWLQKDFGLGLGHAKAIVHVILHGDTFELKHTTGAHRDASNVLRLDGIKNRHK